MYVNIRCFKLHFCCSSVSSPITTFGDNSVIRFDFIKAPRTKRASTECAGAVGSSQIILYYRYGAMHCNVSGRSGLPCTRMRTSVTWVYAQPLAGATDASCPLPASQLTSEFAKVASHCGGWWRSRCADDSVPQHGSCVCLWQLCVPAC